MWWARVAERAREVEGGDNRIPTSSVEGVGGRREGGAWVCAVEVAPGVDPQWLWSACISPHCLPTPYPNQATAFLPTAANKMSSPLP
jgi:hypothetical protein